MKTETTQAKHTESLPYQLRIDADDCPRPDRAGLMIKAADRLEEYERKVRSCDALAASHAELADILLLMMADCAAHGLTNDDVRLHEAHAAILRAKEVAL